MGRSEYHLSLPYVLQNCPGIYFSEYRRFRCVHARNILHLETDAIGTVRLLTILFGMKFSCIFF